MNRPIFRSEINRLKIPCVDWTNVRPVYKMLQDRFHLLTSPFGIEVTPEANLHLSHLIATIDALDRTLDSLESIDDRHVFSASLIRFLDGTTETFHSSHASNEVFLRTWVLRSVISMAGVQKEFCITAKQILEHSEAKRQTTCVNEMLEQMRIEWRLTGHLTILLLGNASTPAFEKFFYLLCETMTSVDMIQDARDDYRDGQIKNKPCAILYFRLLAGLVGPVPTLAKMLPHPFVLLKYATSFFLEGLFSKWRSSTVNGG